jgi:hypothetical protein
MILSMTSKLAHFTIKLGLILRGVGFAAVLPYRNDIFRLVNK